MGDTRSLDYSSYRETGKEHGNYCVIIGYILGLYGYNGKENGNYYNRVYIGGYMGIMEKKMGTTVL